MKTLEGKVILVTGSSRGIGAAIARQLADAGGSIIINYSGSEADAADLVETITDTGGNAIAIRADVSIPKDVDQLFELGISHYGKIDVLVNNAGIMITKPFRDTSDEDFERQFSINVKGVFNTMRKAITHLASNGSIINITTSVSRLIAPTYGTYSASKVAVEQMSRVLSREIGRGINVNCVAPGPTNTTLFTNGKSQETIERLAALNPFNRIAEPAEIAGVVVFLASDEAKWINAQTIGVNGGMA
jgi:3-oxoacyl-[acyl-carrier protein] reductase